MPALLLALALVTPACDLMITLEPATYEDLDDDQRSAADRIFARLQAYHARLRAISGGQYGLGPIAEDKDRIDVSVLGKWVMLNLGDDRIHITTWENLTAEQRERWASWFGEGLEAAAARYRTFFYDYVALHLAGIQTLFSVQGVNWVYVHRGTFSVDRDAQRMAVDYLTETERSLFDFARSTCSAIRARFDERWAAHYDKFYYGDHVRDLADPDDPTGHIWFLCAHLEAGEARRLEGPYTFAGELDVLVRLRSGDY
ncbi:MAG: hypothetical protein HY905_02345 [Deltaproteobacteria bacterium]|nr:hypothetical protein [Deltaproteobacteria bacterium]